MAQQQLNRELTPVDRIDATVGLCIDAGVVPFVVGPAGIGKTAGFSRIASLRDVAFNDITLSDLDLPDLRLPYVSKGVMEFAFDERWPIERYAKLHPEKGILLVDEITGCDQIMQRPIWRLALERKLGGERLLPGWSIGLAGNGVTDRAGANILSFPLTNRLCVIQVGAPTIDGWRKWAISKNLDARVIGWIYHSPASLYAFNAERYDAGVWSQPTPRAWEKVADLLKKTRNLMEPGVSLGVSGLVGIEEATKALAWMRLGDDLPDIESILEGREMRVPETPGGNMILCAGLAARTEPEDLPNLAKYAKGLKSEFRKLLTADLAQRGSRLINAPGFAKLL